jgi:hypothetical protein
MSFISRDGVEYGGDIRLLTNLASALEALHN